MNQKNNNESSQPVGSLSDRDESHLEKNWIERNVNGIIWGLIVVCASTLVAQWWWGPLFNEHHPAHFPVEKAFGFEAALGFLAFVGVVFLGWLLRFVIKRPENYYDA